MGVTKENVYSRKKKVKKMKMNKGNLKIAKIAKQVVDEKLKKKIEYKVFSDANQLIDVSVTGQVIQLTRPIQGITDNNIIGTIYNLEYVRIKWSMEYATALDFVRLLVIQDVENNDNAFTLVDLFPNLIVDGINNLPNWSTRLRYKILYDEVFALSATDQGTSGEIYINKFPRKRVECTGQPIAVPYQARGHVYFIAISDNPTELNPRLSYDFRIKYSDA